MTSTITNYTNSIDVNYPVAGVDNSSLGFRSNFSAIKSALDATSAEISDLQLNLVSLDGTNNFGGNQIKSASLIDCSNILKNYDLSSDLKVSIPALVASLNCEALYLASLNIESASLIKFSACCLAVETISPVPCASAVNGRFSPGAS